MEYTQEIRVLYADTDSYGVVWHGAYTKWFEAARVGLIELLGFDVAELENEGVLFPVVEMNIRYKSSAKMYEQIIIKTHITEVSSYSVKFEHSVREKTTNKLRVTANVTIVTIDTKTGKLYRKMPDKLLCTFKNAV